MPSQTAEAKGLYSLIHSTQDKKTASSAVSQVYVLRGHLIRVGRALDVLSQGHNTTELFLVMLTGPLICNIAQAKIETAGRT